MRYLTPTELAVELWGAQEGHSRRPGPRKIREVARDAFGSAPGGRWFFGEVEARLIRERLNGEYLSDALVRPRGTRPWAA